MADRRQGGCSTKRHYASRQEAEAAIRRLADQAGMQAYVCSFCGEYHIGHSRGANL